MTGSEAYNTTVDLPGVGTVQLLVNVHRGYQGGRVVRQSVAEVRYANGELLKAADRDRAQALLPDVE